jgi:hypothetical protein
MDDAFSDFIEKVQDIGLDIRSLGGIDIGKACRGHARFKTPDIVGYRNLILVHPYFDELEFGEYDTSEYGGYTEPSEIKRMENLLRNVDRNVFMPVLFDSYKFYAQKGFKLVEEGLISKVVFTPETQGLPLNPADLEDFRHSKENLIFGCYGHKACELTATRSLREYAPFWSIRPVRDGIVDYLPGIYSHIRGTTTSDILKRSA